MCFPQLYTCLLSKGLAVAGSRCKHLEGRCGILQVPKDTQLSCTAEGSGEEMSLVDGAPFSFSPSPLQQGNNRSGEVTGGPPGAEQLLRGALKSGQEAKQRRQRVSARGQWEVEGKGGLSSCLMLLWGQPGQTHRSRALCSLPILPRR